VLSTKTDQRKSVTRENSVVETERKHELIEIF
jgi:hypothetical protein